MRAYRCDMCRRTFLLDGDLIDFRMTATELEHPPMRILYDCSNLDPDEDCRSYDLCHDCGQKIEQFISDEVLKKVGKAQK